MKKIYVLFSLFVLSLVLLGAKISTNILKIGNKVAEDIIIEFDIGASPNPAIRYNNSAGIIEFSHDGAQFFRLGSGSGSGSGGGINLLATNFKNPDFENQNPPTDWTASGGVFDAEITNPGFGGQSGRWDSDALNQTLKSALVAVPEGLKGRSCLARIFFKYTGSVGDYVIRVEDGTNALTSDLDLTDTSGKWTTADLSFVCPTSGSVQIVLESKVADGAVLLLDDAHLGSDFRIGPVNENAEIIARAHYHIQNGANKCLWTQTGDNTLKSLTADADCVLTITTNNSNVVFENNDGLPTLPLQDLPPGKYLVRAIVSGFRIFTSGGLLSALLTDGTTDGQKINVRTDAVTQNELMVLEYYFETSSVISKTLELKMQITSGASLNFDDPFNTGTEDPVIFTVFRMPSNNSREAVTLETQGWFIDAAISGSNGIDLGTTTQKFVPNASTLSLATSAGSKPAKIACIGEASTGSTCATNNEAVGLTFTAPRGGNYEVCFDFVHQVSSTNGRIDNIFSIAKTGAADEIISVEGKERLQRVRHSDTFDRYMPTKICDIFSLSAGEHTFKLFDSVDNLIGTVTNLLIANPGFIGGEIKITVTPYTNQFPQAVVLTGQHEIKPELVSTTTGVQNNPVDGNFYDTQPSLNLTLEPGKWLITANLTCYIQQNSGSGGMAATANLRKADNTVLQSAICAQADLNAGLTDGYGNATLTIPVELTTTETFKVSISTLTLGAGNTASIVSFNCNTTFPCKVHAAKIGNVND